RDSNESASAQRQDARGGEIVAGGDSDGWGRVMTHSHTTQYHTVKRIDNSRLATRKPKGTMKDCGRTVALGAAMAACLLTYAWQHFECIQLHYQLEQLQTARAQALELNQQLHVEDATLRAPGRIDNYARQHLGLTVAAPGQQSWGDASDAVVAQARAAGQPVRPLRLPWRSL